MAFLDNRLLLWQCNCEGGALVGCAGDIDGALVGVDDAFGDGEPQACTTWSRGEVGREDLFECFGRDARPGV